MIAERSTVSRGYLGMRMGIRWCRVGRPRNDARGQR